jgi:uncharacterized protein (UPF0335 family)
MAKSGFAKDQLKSFINRVERLLEEKAAIASDIKEVYTEAQNSGFDTKTMRRVIRERKVDKAQKDEADAMFELYWGALDGTPLAEAAKSRAA